MSECSENLEHNRTNFKLISIFKIKIGCEDLIVKDTRLNHKKNVLYTCHFKSKINENTYHKAPLSKVARNSPTQPGITSNLSNTKNGRISSGFAMKPSCRGSHRAYAAYTTIPTIQGRAYRIVMNSTFQYRVLDNKVWIVRAVRSALLHVRVETRLYSLANVAHILQAHVALHQILLATQHA